MDKNILLLDDSIESKIINFFINNPNPSDDAVHDFAEENSINKHRLEEEIYKLVSAFLSGGKYQSDGKNLTYDDAELVEGDKIELEHVNKESPYAKYIARRIALDHLAEFDGKHYYTGLIKLEEDIEKKMEIKVGEQTGGHNGNKIDYKNRYLKYKAKYLLMKNKN
jgi:hypothetical protein